MTVFYSNGSTEMRCADGFGVGDDFRIRTKCQLRQTGLPVDWSVAPGLPRVYGQLVMVSARAEKARTGIANHDLKPEAGPEGLGAARIGSAEVDMTDPSSRR